MTKPLLIFDGDCPFCRRWISYWRTLTGDRVDYAPYQEVGDRYPSITTQQFQSAVQLVEPDGTIASGADAVFRALARRPRLGWLNWVYRKIPGVARVTEAAYRLVARNRVAFSRISTWLFGERIEPARYGLTRWIYLRGLGAVYLAAFVSFWVQARGLVGPEGIIPSGFSDSSLHLMCAAGSAASATLLLGPTLGGWLALGAAAAAWASYWLVMRAGGQFLGFQWDALMLEMGFFSLFLALGAREPFRLAVWSLRWLLFRVMFFSGYVKLASGDAAWRDLTALRYHFETQPLPTWIGWWFHQLPPWALKAGAAGMFALELAVPFLYFLPRRPRFAAFAATVLFQLLIDATGNYGFFGLQAIVLAILLLDDQLLRSALGPLARLAGYAGEAAPAALPFTPRRGAEAALLAPALLLLAFTTMYPVPIVERLAAPLGAIHSYGVFAVMTTTRNEIVFEGSRDGKAWAPYELKWKPGDPKRAPAFVGPHMPRLDWQLWFAALGNPGGYNLWVETVAGKLLKGSEPVLALFGSDPFGGSPPRYVRATFYQYRFTDLATRRRTGEWWERESVGYYLAPMRLSGS